MIKKISINSEYELDCRNVVYGMDSRNRQEAYFPTSFLTAKTPFKKEPKIVKVLTSRLFSALLESVC